ncbi:hypothetical protein SS1G_04157 [Sclerotinia sclerotiorum 1980 UF-70]|uniref:Large ribosomal subunit protein mL50 n=2 Tax=Sclerotinia sclerotiorum (strain ATCC 18683 / 1980 / Ss-1) TaxID=665079 RepID=A7EFR6_SCLS1|nr:hypothetical protein SS1G_04157 [Sclerotinia sclerotiorum 1980 UF-70]APA07129.1 hypothetical protein sscle_02g018990 [Sclerotinia sclerotiorum 1980 UF-70]EDO01682.1 hypothetical protein SS1G_04157 [Sclerotinia sclerotiorum 1980 UF-70]
MRRITRIDRSIGLIRTRPISQNSNTYRCSACKNQTSSFSTSLRADKESLGERVRRSLFKQGPSTSSDPYTGPSQLSAQEREPEFERKERISAEDAYDYEPAENGLGLETIGGYEGSWGAELDSNYPYKLFIPKIKDSVEAATALHRAIVEVFALKQARRPLSEISQTEPSEDFTGNVQINPSGSGAILQFPGNGSLEQIIKSLAPPKKGKQRRKARLVATSSIDETTEKGSPTQSEEDFAADRSPVDPLHPGPTPKINDTTEKGVPTESEEDVTADRSPVDPLKTKAKAQAAPWGNSWLQISLEDPAVKFAVVKRTMQLIGKRIPDNVISSSSTAEKLLQHLITPPKPPTLNKALKQNEELLSLPNVSVFRKRITPVDKERNVGRLKVIREEFKSRGLMESNKTGWTGRGPRAEAI